MPIAFDFAGRVALVTGGASGLGAASAEILAASGAEVAVFDLRPVEKQLSIVGDISSSSDIEAAVASVEARFGRLDILVNCAGGYLGNLPRTVDVTDEEWRRVTSVNFDGSFFACRAVIPGMVERGYGRIVLFASIAGKEGNARAVAYSASKAGVMAMAKSIGKDLAGSGVLVNCIAPGVIETPILAGLTSKQREAMVAHSPLGRPGRPDDVAILVAYLASEEMQYATGATFRCLRRTGNPLRPRERGGDAR